MGDTEVERLEKYLESDFVMYSMYGYQWCSFTQWIEV